MTYTSAPGSEQLAAAIDEALAQPTLCAAFQVTAAANARRPALRHFRATESESISFAQAAARVERIAGGLAGLGVHLGDPLGLMLDNRNEFHLADLAALHLGALPFSIYHSNPAEKVAPLLENAGARVLVSELHYAQVLREAMRLRPDLEATIVVVGAERGEGDLTLAELEDADPPAGFDFEATWRAVGPDTLGMLIHTSGTTGEPKGAEWAHGAMMENLRALHTLIPVSPGGRIVSYLPMAHLAERFMSHQGMIAYGLTITSASNADLAQALREVQPTRFFGVPRIYEKLAEPARVLASSDPDGARQGLGFAQAEYLGSSAAPARQDILALFDGLGLTLIENWGMSETGLTLMNPPGAVRAGTVGKPVPGVRARLAEDGELLIRGPIFSSYRGDPVRTRDAFDDEGWLHTGDVAAIDEDGYYSIVDRKKDIIINSAGKNMAPVYIESVIKQQTPMIAYVAAIGDGRKYVTALLTLDEDQLAAFAADRGLDGDYPQLVRSSEVQAEVAGAIDAANQRLARVEQIKKFHIVDEPWAPGTELVTSSMKLRRRAINDRYAREIDDLYVDSRVPAG
jgi:long-subunit acyl-CoA synthetase (AMP-forming)